MSVRLSQLTAVLALCLIASEPAISTAPDRESPIRSAIGFLSREQVSRPLDVVIDGVRVVDFPGNWPQFFQLEGAQWLRVRDVSPFMVAFIHQALTHVVEKNRGKLGLSRDDIAAARLMRRRALAFISRFRSPAGEPDAGTFAFWPYDADPSVPDPFLAFFLTAWLQGPILGGQRVPLNLALYPGALGIPSDADVTATAYAALLDDARLDGGPGTDVPFERFFTDWRDLGLVARRLNPGWLPPASGAYLTWLTYRDPPFPLFPNDVDLAVNANVLYALARYGRLDTAGAADAVSLINLVTALGIHRDRLDEITDYYPDNLAFHYIVSRAFRWGPVHTLGPAVEILADELEGSALLGPDGGVYWDRGAPQLNTAFAVLTLLNARRDSPLIDRAIDYLVSEQNAAGGYEEATFFVGRADGGQVFEFTSASFTTAVVLEALARYRLARCGKPACGSDPISGTD